MTLPSGAIYFVSLGDNAIYYVPGTKNDFLFYSESNTTGNVVLLGDFAVNPNNVSGKIISAQNTALILNNDSTTAIFQIVNVTFSQVGLNIEPFYDTKIYGTDGTPTGTEMLADFQGYSGIAVYTTQNGLTYFANPSDTAEVYVTDGTAAGTKFLFDAGTGSTVSLLGANENSVLFTALSGTTLSVYGTNGTPGDTAVIASIGMPSNLAATDATSSTATLLGSHGSRTVFDMMNTTLIPTGLGYTTDYVIDVYGTDGTAGGTQLLCQFSAAPQALLGSTGLYVYENQNGITYFADVNNPTEVYATNGTTAGTAEILNTGSGSAISVFTTAGNTVLFQAKDNATLSIYASNGTTARSALIASITEPAKLPVTDASSSTATVIAVDGTRTIFELYNVTFIPVGTSFDTDYVIDVYGSDGTVGGTQLLTQFLAGCGKAAKVSAFVEI